MPKPTTRSPHRILCEPDLWRALQDIAVQENTTISTLMRRLFVRYLQRRSRFPIVDAQTNAATAALIRRLNARDPLRTP